MQIINWMRNRKEDKFIQRLENDIHSKKYQREKEEAIDFKKKIEQLPIEKQKELLLKAAGHAEKRTISVSFYTYPRYEFVGKSTQQLIEEYRSVFDFLHPEFKEEMLEELKRRKAMRK